MTEASIKGKFAYDPRLLFFVLLFFFIVCGAAYLAFNQMEKDLRGERIAHLASVNLFINRSLESRVEDYWRRVDHLAESVVIVDAISQLLTAHKNHQAIVDHPAQLQAKNEFEKQNDHVGASDYFILDLDGELLASYQSNVTAEDMLAQVDTDVLRHVWRGDQVLIPPFFSSALTAKGDLTTSSVASILFVKPITNSLGRVIAIICLRFDPVGSISHLLELTQVNKTEFSYVINDKGLLFGAGSLSRKASEPSLQIGYPLSSPAQKLTANDLPSLQERREWPLTLAAKNIQTGMSGFNSEGYLNSQGDQVIGIWTWSDELNIGVITEVSTDAALASFNKLRFPVMLALALCFLASLIFIYIIRKMAQRNQDTLLDEVEKQTGELANAKQALEQEQILLKLVFDSIPELIFAKSIDGTYLTINRGFEKLTGKTVSEIVGKTDQSLFTPLVVEKMRDQDHQVLKRNAPQQFEEWLLSAGSGRALFETLKQPLYSSTGEQFGLVGIMRDITQQKSAELELRKLSLVIEQSQFSVVITNKLSEIEYVNPSFSTISGYSFEEAVGSRPHILKSFKHPKEYYQSLIQTIHSGKAWRGELINLRKDGSEYWERASISPIFDDKHEITHFVAVKEDITEAKAMELALKEAEYTRAQVLDSARVGLWGSKLEQEQWLWSWDKQFCQMIRVTVSGQASLDSWLNSIHPHDLQRVKHAIEVMQVGGCEYNDFDFRCITDDGSFHYYQARGKVGFNEHGIPIRLDGIISDTTSLKLAEARADSERQRFQVMFEKNSVAQIILSQQGLVIGCNQAATRLFGYSDKSMVISQGIESLLPLEQEDGQLSKECFAQILLSPNILIKQRADWLLQRFDSSVFPAELQMSFVELEMEPHLLLAAHDLSERKQAELALETSEERMTLATQAANLGLWDWNIITDELIVNQVFDSMLGYTETTVLHFANKRVSLIHPEDLPMVEQSMREHMSGNTALYENEHRMRKADGTWLWVLEIGKVTEFNELGEALRFIGIQLDISKSKDLQEGLELARDAAEAATKAKSDFLANMSHEIRTPMNAIIGMSHLALQTDLNRKQTNYIKKVNYSAESLLGIINDILDFSKIEAGKLNLEHTPFELEQVLTDLANNVSLKAENKGLTILFKIAAEVPNELIGDPLRLGQILLNLVNNAVKFTEQGHVGVTVALDHKDANDLKLKFAIIDTGIGLSSEQQGKLFQAFSQADTSTTRQYGGTGLGLTISERIAHLMGGEIGVESQQGQGSTFWFTACLQATKTTVCELPMSTSLMSSNQRWLLVEHAPFAQDVLTSVIEQAGVEFDLVSSGSEALTCIADATQPYTLIIIDRELPELDGVATIAHLQAEDETLKALPVVLLTAYPHNVELKAQQASLACTHLVSKPYTAHSLLSSVYQVLSDTDMQEPSISSTFANQSIEPALQLLAGAKILLVEDNEINQELALELLASNGMQVKLAHNGQEAIDFLAQEEFDGVLMDCQMPVMDGYTATKLIRQQAKYQALPILAMTANAMDGDIEQALASGMNAHIAKPISIEAMFTTMAEWIKAKIPVAMPSVSSEKSSNHTVLSGNIDGIDIPAGLAVCQSDERLFLKLLSKFVDEYQDYERHFIEAYQSSLDAAERYAHSLKGVSASIGAQHLSELAKYLETACLSSQKEDIEHQHSAIITCLSHLIPDCITFIAAHRCEPATEKVSPIIVDEQQVQVFFKQLRILLLDDDTEAIDIVEQLQDLLDGDPRSATLINLEKAISAYDFDLALLELAKLEGSENA